MIFRRVGGRLSEVLPAWEGETAVLIGGGPSLRPDQIAAVQRWHERAKGKCIAVNDAYLIAPFANVLHFADARWWLWHVDGIARPILGLSADEVSERFQHFTGELSSMQTSMRGVLDERVHFLRNAHYPGHGEGLSRDPGALVSGKNSGFQALNLAILAGAKRIILLGYDGGPAMNGAEHWHEGYPVPTHPQTWSVIRRSFEAVEREIEAGGVRVFNCSPGSQLGFRRIDLEEALAER